MNYRKPNFLVYWCAQGLALLLSVLFLRRKILRNELKGKKGPYVVIGNHQAALDFINLAGITHHRMTFVVSNSFYHSLPVTGLLEKAGVIPKQQFQTSVGDMKKMKAVIQSGHPLVIYPAGLMCEDGRSTPIPHATYKFLKWLGVDVYVARTSGTYFSMPKWAKGIRSGRTYLDVYQLFTKEELAQLTESEIENRTTAALDFDAYREQEQLQVRYKNNDNLHGLENVLYVCPHCGAEFTIFVENNNTLSCKQCGYTLQSDLYGFLHNHKGLGQEMRYVSDWSRWIYERRKSELNSDHTSVLQVDSKVHLLDHKKHGFAEAGQATLTVSREKITLQGEIAGESVTIELPSVGIPSLPFSPGKYLELQHGKMIYRCVLIEGHLVMKIINTIKANYELSNHKIHAHT